jgi:hypothetical protein
VADAAAWSDASFSHTSALPVVAGVACADTVHFVLAKLKDKVTLRLAVYRQAVRLGVKHFEAHD